MNRWIVSGGKPEFGGIESKPAENGSKALAYCESLEHDIPHSSFTRTILESISSPAYAIESTSILRMAWRLCFGYANPCMEFLQPYLI